MTNERQNKSWEERVKERISKYIAKPEIAEWLSAIPDQYRELALNLSIAKSNFMPIKPAIHRLIGEFLAKTGMVIYNYENDFVEYFDEERGIWRHHASNVDAVHKAINKYIKIATIRYVVKKGDNLDVYEVAFSDLLTRNLLANIIEIIKQLSIPTFNSLIRGMFIEFGNGLIMDMRKWAYEGTLYVVPASPQYYVYHAINAPLKPEIITKIMNDEKLDLYTAKFSVAELLEKYAPYHYRVFRSWVDGNDDVDGHIELLTEIAGYILLPEYKLHKGFVLLGDGSNGKSTFIRKISAILGYENVASVALQDLVDNRFMRFQLYRKLANLVYDIPRRPIKDTGVIKALLGEDLVEADRKYMMPLRFVNYAKFIGSANMLPATRDTTYGWYRRWIIIRFPNRFKNNPEFEHEFLTHPETPNLIAVALLALRRLIVRSQFAVTREVSYEHWLYHSEPVYMFIVEMIKEGVLIENEKEKVERDKLYALYVDWCEQNRKEKVDKTMFTKIMAQLGYTPIMVKGVRYYKGLRLNEGNALLVGDANAARH